MPLVGPEMPGKGKAKMAFLDLIESKNSSSFAQPRKPSSASPFASPLRGVPWIAWLLAMIVLAKDPRILPLLPLI